MISDVGRYSASSIKIHISLMSSHIDCFDKKCPKPVKLTNQDRPHRNENKKPQISNLLQGENHRENMIRKTLRPPIQRVESITGKRRRHSPFVVRFVKPAVYEWVMQAAMNPVDSTVGEADEKRVLQQCVSPEWGLAGEIV